MPSSIWRSAFGRDREGLIGHPIDAEKLAKKIPENLAKLDMQLSMLEPMFDNEDSGNWIFSTSEPSMADLSLYYELKWAQEIASGKFTQDITAGETSDGKLEGADPVFNARRYPRLFAWFKLMERYFDSLEDIETKASEDFDDVVEQMKEAPSLGPKSLLLPTPRSVIAELEAKSGLVEGAKISIAPDDTGMNEYVALPALRGVLLTCVCSPTIGTLIAMSPEELVMKPMGLEKPATVDVRIHFPRLGFVARPYKGDKAKL